MEGGESIPQLAKRVEAVMGDRIRSSATTIARTEVIGAYNGGGLIAATAAGATHKQWQTAMDERVRDSHAAAHGQIVPVDEDFEVGGVTGPAPGDMGDPGEDINCRCGLRYPVE